MDVNHVFSFHQKKKKKQIQTDFISFIISPKPWICLPWDFICRCELSTIHCCCLCQIHSFFDNNIDFFSASAKTSIKTNLLPLPPIYASNWESANRFPVGAEFVNVFLNGEILIWGGMQKQIDGKNSHLPDDVIYTYKPPPSPFIAGEWNVKKVTGPNE